MLLIVITITATEYLSLSWLYNKPKSENIDISLGKEKKREVNSFKILDIVLNLTPSYLNSPERNFLLLCVG